MKSLNWWVFYFGVMACIFSSAAITYWSMVFISRLSGLALSWSEVVLSCTFGLMFFLIGFSFLLVEYLVSEGYL
jgi:hypothetical protein